MDGDLFTSGDIAAAEHAVSAPAGASPTQHPAESQTTDAAPRVQTETIADVHGQKGIPPESEWPRIIGGLHEKIDRLSALSWADSLDRDQVFEAMRLRELYERNPGALADHLSTRVNASKEPQPNVQDQQTGEWFYSPTQAAKLAKFQADVVKAELQHAMDERLGPIEASRTEQALTESLVGEISHAVTWKGFDEHMDAITDLIAQRNTARASNPSLPPLDLRDAYIQVVVPKLAQTDTEREITIRKKIAEELRSTSAQTKDELNPSRGPAASHKKNSEKSWNELFQEEMAKRSA